MSEGSLIVADAQSDKKYIPDSLQATYAQMPVEDQNLFAQIENQWNYNEREFVVKTGDLLKQVQELVKHPGVRDGLTFERWYTAHGLKKRVVYRCIAIANGYHHIKAQNAPDEARMLENFLSLNQKIQEAIGRGNIDPVKENYLLHTDPTVRDSPVWKQMVKEISDRKKNAKEQEDTIVQLKEQNRQLSSQLATSENKRANLADQLQQVSVNRHHLELQLEDERNREPETIIIPPDDYDDLAAEVQKNRNELNKKEQQLKQLQQALAESPSKKDVGKYEGNIKKLRQQNSQLMEQIKNLTTQMDAKKERHLSHKSSYEKVATISSQWLRLIDSEFNIQQLVPDVGNLSNMELEQIGLLRIADVLSERSKQIRKQLATNEIGVPGKVVQADFQDNDRFRKRG